MKVEVGFLVDLITLQANVSIVFTVNIYVHIYVHIYTCC